MKKYPSVKERLSRLTPIEAKQGSFCHWLISEMRGSSRIGFQDKSDLSILGFENLTTTADGPIYGLRYLDQKNENNFAISLLLVNLDFYPTGYSDKETTQRHHVISTTFNSYDKSGILIAACVELQHEQTILADVLIGDLSKESWELIQDDSQLGEQKPFDEWGTF